MNRLLPLLVLVPLAACNSQPSVDLKNANPKEVASAVSSAASSGQFVRPGKWQTKYTMEAVDMPGMPQEMAKRMQAAMSRVQTSESCLTAAEVNKPKADFFAGAQKDCTYKHFTMSGGTIDMAMECKREGSTMAMTINGTYSADHYTAHTTMTGSGGRTPGGQGMTMKANIEANRVGDCTKEQEKEG